MEGWSANRECGKKQQRQPDEVDGCLGEAARGSHHISIDGKEDET